MKAKIVWTLIVAMLLTVTVGSQALALDGRRAITFHEDKDQPWDDGDPGEEGSYRHYALGSLVMTLVDDDLRYYHFSVFVENVRSQFLSLLRSDRVVRSTNARAGRQVSKRYGPTLRD